MADILVWARTYPCAVYIVIDFLVLLIFLVSFNFCFLLSDPILNLISISDLESDFDFAFASDCQFWF